MLYYADLTKLTVLLVIHLVYSRNTNFVLFFFSDEKFQEANQYADAE